MPAVPIADSRWALSAIHISREPAGIPAYHVNWLSAE